MISKNPPPERSRRGAYGVAIASFAIAVAIRGAFTPALGFGVPFITFFPAVMASSAYGGLGPGLVTAALSALAAQYLFLQPAFTFAFRSLADTLALLLFLAVSVFICILTDRLHLRVREASLHLVASESSREQLAVEIEERERSNRKEADVRRWAHDTLSSIGDGVVCTDIDGTVTFINTVAEELTGWRATEALGRPMRDVFNIINETSRAPAVNPIGRVLSEGVVLGLANHTVLIGQSGREVPIDDSGAPIRNAQREIVGAVLVFRDISDRKLAEELLQRTVARLTRSNEDLTAFAHALSHDLQEPVRAIGTISELLVQQHGAQLDDKAREHLHFIIGAAARLTQMIRSLLAYARMVNAQEGTMSPVRLADAVNWAEANLHQLVNVHGVRIECTDLPTVVGNEVQLVQIFQNLIENAIKYRSTEAPILHISATEHDNDWEIILRDNGLGIDPCYHQEIFRLFKRAHTIGDGSGIGLAVCKRIVERHGGTIWVNSTPGDGSTFHFTLSKDPQLAV